MNGKQAPNSTATANGRLLDQLPDPEVVRTRLAACTQEASMLRALLRLAERTKRQRSGGKEAARV